MAIKKVDLVNEIKKIVKDSSDTVYRHQLKKRLLRQKIIFEDDNELMNALERAINLGIISITLTQASSGGCVINSLYLK